MRLGSHHSEESKKKTSAVLMGNINAVGHKTSPETRAKLSTAHQGHVMPLETRLKIATTTVGRRLSDATRAKMSATRTGPLHWGWKGGPSVWQRKQRAKRRTLGFVQLNAPFAGCAGHHVDNEQVINMPAKLHQSISHNQHTGRGMAQMNAVSYNYLFKQEVEAAIKGA